MVKIKTSNFLTLFLLFVSLLGSAFVFNLLFAPELLSPKGVQQIDLVKKIQEKISKQEKLDYSNAKTIPSLNNIPRYLVYNPKTYRVYLAKNYQERFSPASFTKLLTTQVALDLISPDQYLTATKTSVDKIPTILGLKPGEQLKANDLIRASIATSANDAVQTLAEGISNIYDIPLDNFIDLMNRKALLLGMENSHFANPDGLDDQNQYSTLEDLPKLIHNAQQNYPEITKNALSDNQDIEKTDFHDHYYLPNWNGLLGVYPGVTGLKIAYTENAGYSTILTAKREGTEAVVILSGANSFIERDLAGIALLNHAFMAEKIAPVKITASQIKKRYQQWAALATKIRQSQ